MRKLLVTLDDELDLWLAEQVNQNETVRKALHLYKGNISTDSIDGFRQAFIKTNVALKELDAKLNYISGQLK